MPSPTKSSAKSSTATDAIALLVADHKSVKALFQAFEKLQEREDADDV